LSTNKQVWVDSQKRTSFYSDCFLKKIQGSKAEYSTHAGLDDHHVDVHIDIDDVYA